MRMSALARRYRYWLAWFILTLALGAWMTAKLNGEGDRSLFLPGQTTIGHHQIELACDSCHTGSFSDREDMQVACESCHLEQLKAANDDHPKSKFTDPRNADRVARLNARYCVTCHVEHRPDITLAMGLTLPADYCFVCHEDIGEQRSSHQGLEFDSCASSGCHNFHDNRALYEDFLLRHLDEPAVLPRFEQARSTNTLEMAAMLPEYPKKRFPIASLSAADADAPQAFRNSDSIQDWAASAHAAAGVNCSACHSAGDPEAGDWMPAPGHQQCSSCHGPEVETFLLGKHGMRLDESRLGKTLPPMTPGLARLPMKPSSHGRELGCSSCHASHRYDVAVAAVDSCLACHDDDHSRSYKASPHYESQTGDDRLPIASCADCHMPVTDREYLYGAAYWTFTNHNQSETLLPNEKMLRPACLRCHGMQLSLDALADRALIERNFAGEPTVRIDSLEWARQRTELLRQAKEAAIRGDEP